MKIAYVLGPPLLLTGTGHTRVIPIAERLVKKYGIQIKIFCPSLNTRNKNRKEYIYSGIPVIETGNYFVYCSDNMGFSKDYVRFKGIKLIFVILQQALMTLIEVAKFKPDIIQIFTSQPNTLLFLLFARVLFPRKKIFLDYDDLYGGKGGSYDYEGNSKLLVSILGFFELLPKYICNKISACSHYLFFRFNADVIIPNSIDYKLLDVDHVDDYKLESKKHKKKISFLSDKKIILLVSRIKEIYDYDLVLYAIKNIINEYRNIKAILLGDGDGLDKLKSLSKELRIESVVEFLGFVKDKELLKYYYSIADIAIIPMRKRALHLARCPIKLLDAITAKLCIIVPNWGEAKYILKNNYNAIFYEAGNIEDLSSKIKYILENPDVERKLRKNLNNLGKNFDHDEIAKKWVDYFTSK